MIHFLIELHLDHCQLFDLDRLGEGVGNACPHCGQKNPDTMNLSLQVSGHGRGSQECHCEN